MSLCIETFCVNAICFNLSDNGFSNSRDASLNFSTHKICDLLIREFRVCKFFKSAFSSSLRFYISQVCQQIALCWIFCEIVWWGRYSVLLGERNSCIIAVHEFLFGIGFRGTTSANLECSDIEPTAWIRILSSEL